MNDRSYSRQGSNTVQKWFPSLARSSSRSFAGKMMIWLLTLVLMACPLNFWLIPSSLLAQDLSAVASQAQAKVVKIYGSGGYAGLEDYQSGCLISQEGLVLTAWSYVLDPDSILVVDHLGQKSDATLVGFDPNSEIALLKTSLGANGFFELDAIRRSPSGTNVLAVSNLFKVASGNEPVSVQFGIISLTAPLAASQKATKTPYQGPVYFIDAMSNNPGSSGGALVDSQGKLLGMLGRELQQADGDFWINYAIPTDVLIERIEWIQSGRRLDTTNQQKPLSPISPAALGILLVPRITFNTPAFIEKVSRGSPAGLAGLQANDLILKVQGQLTTNRDDVITALSAIDKFTPLQLTLRREDQILTLSVTQ